MGGDIHRWWLKAATALMESDMIVDIGPARYRNHITQRTTFVCKAVLERLEKEVEEKKEALRRDLEKFRAETNRKRDEIELATEAKKAKLKRELDEVRQQIRLARAGQDCDLPWPSVPADNRRALSLKGDNMPNAAGIYFLWEKSTVVYVGQSINLSGRVRLNHDKAQFIKNAEVTFIEIPREDLNFAECFYIGVLKPRLNFGGHRHPI